MVIAISTILRPKSVSSMRTDPKGVDIIRSSTMPERESVLLTRTVPQQKLFLEKRLERFVTGYEGW